METKSDYPYLKKLNKEQFEAATTIDGKLLILAGAGSGKTATLVARVAYMIDNGIDPASILLLTFTNKAAREMRERIAQSVGDAADKITACTFHSFCAALIRHNAAKVGLKPSFVIMDSQDAKDAMEIVCEEFFAEEKELGREYDFKKIPKVYDLLGIHENAINNCVTLNEMISLTEFRSYTDMILAIDEKFTKFKEERNLVDYNDLMQYTITLFENDEPLRAAIDKRFKYISCDEYQDTNTVQNHILDYMTRDYPNLAVVGDDNQSIYGWRSADIRNILNFDKVHPDCKTIVLYENYRSSQEILDFANAVMSHATEGREKNLHGQFDGLEPELIDAKTVFDEANFICDKITELHSKGTPLKDMAVIIRMARHSGLIEAELVNRGIPYRKFGGIKFLESVAVKDVLAFVKVNVNPKDELAWFRILQLYPGIGKTYAKKISAIIAASGIEALDGLYKRNKFKTSLNEVKDVLKKHQYDSLTDFLEFIIEEYYKKLQIDLINSSTKTTNYKKKTAIAAVDNTIKDLRVLLTLAEKYESAETFLSDIVLDATAEDEENADYLNVTTVHSAKGLEYDTVFIPQLTDGQFPSERAMQEDPAEELRVFYVAITRAKKRLYLTVPSKGGKFSYKPIVPSSFISHENVLETLNTAKAKSLCFC